MCHVIFTSSRISSAMAPKSAITQIPNLSISVTENDYSHINFLIKSLKRRVQRPVTMLTDGHSSRFCLDVQRFNHKSFM